ncbi:Ger(x)C family spore germination protein [Bacillus sp. JJ1773]|uniref:Ger(x)C family spore germination protein n=1 Tax=Bacillus sp. JJ1773 TaxID=3122965 RepID=UPI003000BD50
MVKKVFIPIFCFVFILGGCIQTKTIEKIQIIESIGYDAAEDKKYELTLGVIMFSPQEKGSFTGKTISAANFTGYGAVWNAERELPKAVASGKILIGLFGEGLAKRGIGTSLDGIKRHPSIGRQVDFCIVEGEAKKLLDGKYEIMDQTTSRYIKDLITHSKKGNLPTSNFHEFMYAYYSKGQDAFMPMLKKHGENVQLSGLAFFQKDKYVDKIGAEKLFVFKMLYENMNRGTYAASFPDKDMYISMETLKSKVDYTITSGMTHPKIKINVKMNALIDEVNSNIKLLTVMDVGKFERLLGKDLEEKGLELINQFREKGIDPLGIADRARSQTRGWELKKWQELFSDAPVELNIKIDFLETGISDHH